VSPVNSRKLAGHGALILGILAVALTAQTQPRTRSFHFQYRATIPEMPRGAKRIDLWMPVPQNDPYQKIENLRIESPYEYKWAPRTATP
jgi:hypothetical protein